MCIRDRYVLKEGFMAVVGLVMLRRGKKLDGAKWFGKVCTFVFYLVTVTLIPVSYTHLDVYKRQPVRHAAAIA